MFTIESNDFALASVFLILYKFLSPSFGVEIVSFFVAVSEKDWALFDVGAEIET